MADIVNVGCGRVCGVCCVCGIITTTTCSTVVNSNIYTQKRTAKFPMDQSQVIVQQSIEEYASKDFADHSKVYQRSVKLRALWRESAVLRTEVSDRILLDSMLTNKEDNLLIPPTGGAYVFTSQSDKKDDSNQTQWHLLSGIEEYKGDVIHDFTQLTGNRPDLEEENVGLLEYVPDLVTYYFEKIMESQPQKVPMNAQERSILPQTTITDESNLSSIDGRFEDESGNLNPNLIGILLKCQFGAGLQELEQSAIMNLVSSMTEEELHRNQMLATTLFYNGIPFVCLFFSFFVCRIFF